MLFFFNHLLRTNSLDIREFYQMDVNSNKEVRPSFSLVFQLKNMDSDNYAVKGQ